MSSQNNQNTIPMTSKGLENLKQEYDVLLNKKRPHIVDRLASARAAGDLSENNDYATAIEELEFIDGKIEELAQVLQNAVLIKKKSKSTVNLGTKVTLQANGQKHVFHIVGEWEADPQNKKISHESPLGKALLGKKVGDKVEVEAPIGKVVYKILVIE